MSPLSAITEYLGFTRKPRDGVVAGIPLTYQDQFYLEVHAAVLPATVPTLTLIATTYRPSTNETFTRTIIRYLVTTNDYSLETSATQAAGTFADGDILVSLAVGSSATVPAIGRCHVSAYLFRGGIYSNQLIGDFISNEYSPNWVAGNPVVFKSPFYDPLRAGCIYTFQGEVVNDADGAGVQSVTVAPPTNGRFEVLGLIMINGDTVGVDHSAHIYNGAGTAAVNIIRPLLTSSSVAAAGAIAWPSFSGSTAVGHSTGPPVIVAGANRLVMLTGSVAVSQNTNFGCVLRVWGGAPVFTLAGGDAGATLTTNISRFETG